MEKFKLLFQDIAGFVVLSTILFATLMWNSALLA